MAKTPDKLIVEYKPRNPIIQMAINKEVNLKETVHTDKNKYNRKIKHKEPYE